MAGQKGGVWVIRRTISGAVIEESVFRMGYGVKLRAKKERTSSVRKQDQNDRQGEKILAREINCNFSYHDLLLLLTYDDEALARVNGDRENAKRDLSRFLERLGRAMKKDGLVLRYAGAVTSDMDGESGEPVRVHHHVVLPKEAGPYIDAAWKAGSTSARQLKKQDDYTPIARYLLRQVRRVKNEKRWKSSRNLKKPVVQEMIAKKTGPLRNPTGTILMGESEYDIERGSHYIRYIRAPRPGRGEKKPEAAAARTKKEVPGRNMRR